MKRLALALLLIATPAEALDIYVGPAPCSSVTATCGTTGDDNNRCCTLWQAINRNNGTSGGNRILLDSFTEVVPSASGFPNFNPDNGNGLPVRPTYAVMTKAAEIVPNGTANYTLDINFFLVNGITLSTGSGGSKIWRGAGSFTITHKNDDGVDLDYPGRNGHVQLYSSSNIVDGLIIKDMKKLADGSNNYQGISSVVGIRNSADGNIIRNNEIRGKWNTAIYNNGITGGGSNCTAGGAAIYGNKLISTISPSNETQSSALIVETAGCAPPGLSGAGQNIVFAFNLIDYSGAVGGDRRAVYVRETPAHVIGFGNRIMQAGITRGVLYGQDNVDHSGSGLFSWENADWFNNTITSGGDGEGIVGDQPSQSQWPACIGSSVGDASRHVSFVNNLWSGFTTVAPLGSGCANGSNTSHLRSTNDHFDYNYCYGGGCISLIGGSDVTHVGNLASAADPLLSAFTLDNEYRDAGHLGAGSPAIRACSNNPLGQGPGVCSVTAVGITFDCTRDWEGHQRPITPVGGVVPSWDCGADHFTGTTPAVCKNGLVETGESCDDGLPNGVHSCIYGDDPANGLQQVCNGTCNGQTNCVGPTWCGDNLINGGEPCDGTNMNGHSCSADFGCGGGTPTCVQCVVNVIGCVCGQTTPTTTRGVSFFGVKP